MNKEKIIKNIDTLEKQASQSDKYFMERNTLYKENTNLKQALIDIREYAKRDWDLDSNTKDKLISARRVLQIIDKVGGNE